MQLGVSVVEHRGTDFGMAEQTVPVKDGKAQWRFANRDPLCVLHTAEADALLDGKPYVTARADVFVPRYAPPDFTNWLWPRSTQNPTLTPSISSISSR